MGCVGLLSLAEEEDSFNSGASEFTRKSEASTLNNRAFALMPCFWNHIIASNNAYSFACVLLLPASTQYPARSPYFIAQEFLFRSNKKTDNICRVFVADTMWIHNKSAYLFRKAQSTSRNRATCHSRISPAQTPCTSAFPERLVAVNKPQFAEDRKNQAFFHALNTAHDFCGRIEVYCLSSISPLLENRGIQQ